MFHVRAKIQALEAPRWARGGHAQTLLGHFLPSPALAEPGQRLEINLPQGDKLVARAIRGTTSTSVYLFHGLGGFSHSTYMQRTARLARRLGHTVYMLNHRGCGEGEKLAREPYHSGRAEDLSALIARGREINPGHFHLAIGFSLSGNALLLLAAGNRASVLPDAAIAVNAPINLDRTSQLLSSGWNRIYDVEFMREMRRSIRSRAHLEESLARLHVPLLSTLREFDEIYTAPFGGFRDRNHYYRDCSAKPHLESIKIPTILLTAKDDPFVDYRDYENARVSDKVLVHIENCGGHMGYMSARPTPLGTRRWLDYVLDQYMRLAFDPAANQNI